MNNNWKFNCNAKCVLPLQEMFFSTKNIKFVKEQINNNIFKRTGYKIKEVDDKNIVQIMYQIYGNHKYYSTKLNQQLNKLNDELIFYVSNDMVINLKQYIGYIKKISRHSPLLEYGISSRGNDTIGSLNLNNPKKTYMPFDNIQPIYQPI